MSKKILIIDDDPDTLEVMTLVLQEYNYEIISSRSATIINEVSSLMPDLILLDNWLIEATGADLCKSLKGSKETAKIPIVLISAVIGLDTIALQCGADAYISKPFDIDYLGRVISSTLKSHT